MKLFLPSLLVLSLCIGLSPTAFAAPIEDIVVGARYSVKRIGENRTARVAKIDRSDNTVQIIYDDNSRTQWVRPDELLATYGESYADDASDAVVGGAILLGLGCMLFESCRNAVAESSGSSSSSSGSSSISSGSSSSSSEPRRIYMVNECYQDISIWVKYMIGDDTWSRNGLNWNIDAGKTALLQVDGDYARVYKNNVFIHARSDSKNWIGLESGDSSNNWKDDSSGRWYKRISGMIDNDGDRKFVLTCE